MFKLDDNSVRDSIAVLMTLGFVVMSVLHVTVESSYMEIYTLVIGVFFGARTSTKTGV